MPTPTYIPLATKTLTATATSVTFSSISQAYRDLVLVAEFFPTANANIIARVNADAGAKYNMVEMFSNGASAGSNSASNINQLYVTYWANPDAGRQVHTILNFMDYAATDKHKTVLHRFNDWSNISEPFVTRWASTSAITSIVMTPTGTTFKIGSTFTLYGIAS